MFLRAADKSGAAGNNYALGHVNKVLIDNGRTLRWFPAPYPAFKGPYIIKY